MPTDELICIIVSKAVWKRLWYLAAPINCLLRLTEQKRSSAQVTI